MVNIFCVHNFISQSRRRLDQFHCPCMVCRYIFGLLNKIRKTRLYHVVPSDCWPWIFFDSSETFFSLSFLFFQYNFFFTSQTLNFHTYLHTFHVSCRVILIVERTEKPPIRHKQASSAFFRSYQAPPRLWLYFSILWDSRRVFVQVILHCYTRCCITDFLSGHEPFGRERTTNSAHRKKTRKNWKLKDDKIRHQAQQSSRSYRYLKVALPKSCECRQRQCDLNSISSVIIGASCEKQFHNWEQQKKSRKLVCCRSF